MDLYKYYTEFNTSNEIFILYGDFSDEITSHLSDLNSNLNTDDKKISKRLSYLTIETFQNIVRHGYQSVEEKNSKRIKKGMFAYTKVKDGFILGTVNEIKNEKAEVLKTQLEELNQLNEVELKEKYIETLYREDRTENGGAGVGLISVLRKSTGNISYIFEPINDKINRFFFQSNLIKSTDITPDFLTEKFFNLMSENDIVLFRKGIFNHSYMLLITELLDAKLNVNSDSAYGKSFFFIVRELLQNIYQHSKTNNNEGVFLLREDQDKLNICCGNFIESSKIKPISAYIDQLNSLDKLGLKELYKEKLFSQMDFENTSSSGGIGLLEIKKLVNSQIYYNFDTVSEKMSFFSIKVSI